MSKNTGARLMFARSFAKQVTFQDFFDEKGLGKFQKDLEEGNTLDCM